jgi:hypothetical protein
VFRKVSGCNSGEVRGADCILKGFTVSCPTPNFVSLIKSIKRRWERKCTYGGKNTALRRLRWDDNIKTNLKEIRWDVID